jgi:hypothetical protein
MGLSRDPRARQKQLANLRPGAAIKHGGSSQLLLEPLRERHRCELKADYPHLDGRRLAILADLLASLELACGYLDRRGLVADRRTLEVRPIVAHVDRWRREAWSMLAQLDAEQRAKTDDPHAAWRALEAKYAEEADGADPVA